MTLFCFRIAACAVLGFVASVSAATLEETAAVLYRPLQGEMVALSPDGRHVAYTRHARAELSVVIVDVDNPAARVAIAVADDRRVTFSKEKEAVRLRFLRWITPNRLVFAPTEEVIATSDGERIKVNSPIIAADANGKNAKRLVEGGEFSVMIEGPSRPDEPPNFIELPRNINVLGFPAGDFEHILVEALATRPTPPREMSGERQLAMTARQASRRLVQAPKPTATTLFKINVFTGKVSQLGDDAYPGRFLYDRQGRMRIVYAQTERSADRKFLVKSAAANSRWLALDEKSAGPAASGFTLSPANYFGARAFPLAFDFDAKVLYFASNAGRDTFGIYGLDLESKRRTSLAIEHPYFDLAPLEPRYPQSPLVFDERRQQLAGVRTTGVAPLTVWVDPELVEVQRTLEKKFPRRAVEVLEWDDARRRFLVRVSSVSDPGRHFVYERKEDLLVEFLRRAPWLQSADLHDSMAFEFDTPTGVHLTGYLTLPRTSRLNPPPLLVYFPAGFPARAQPEFDVEAQMLAGLGFMVARVNHRGAVGFGARHRDAIQAGVDRVPVDDVLAAIGWLGERHKFDRRRVATMGEGFGGYLALRALQLHPDTFRCAIALDAPLDLEAWLRPAVRGIEQGPAVDFTQEVQRAFFQRNATRLAEASVLGSVATLMKPVFLIVNSQRHDEIASENSRLRSELKRLGRAPEYLEVQEDFVLRLPAARARAFRRIEEFFNLNLYDYKVNVGEVKEIK